MQVDGVGLTSLVLGAADLMLIAVLWLKLRYGNRRFCDTVDDRLSAYRHNFETTISKIQTIESELSILKTQVAIFWKGVSFSSSQILHSPHDPFLDNLIERYQDDLITDEELVTFKARLRDIMADERESRSRRKAAREVFLLIYMQNDLSKNVLLLSRELNTAERQLQINAEVRRAASVEHCSDNSYVTAPEQA